VAKEICSLLSENPAFARSTEKIESNPFPIKTEREAAVEEKDLPVYRTMFVRS
jgi:hypothetical protein